MNQISFVDTSAWLAIYNARDKHARAARDFVKQHSHLVTTNFIIDETITLVLSRVGYRVALQVGEDLWSEKISKIITITRADQEAAWALFKTYDDKRFSFTDCTSFAVMRRLGLALAFTFDDDFVQTGLFAKVP